MLWCCVCACVCVFYSYGSSWDVEGNSEDCPIWGSLTWNTLVEGSSTSNHSFRDDQVKNGGLCVCVCVFVHVLCICVLICVCMFVCMHVSPCVLLCMFIFCECLCMCICMHGSQVGITQILLASLLRCWWGAEAFFAGLREWTTTESLGDSRRVSSFPFVLTYRRLLSWVVHPEERQFLG